MKTVSKTMVCLLLDAGQRKAGSYEKDGKTLEYGAADTLTVLPFGDQKGEIQRLNSHPSVALGSLYKRTDDLHWGAVLKLSLSTNGKILSLEVLGDVMEPYFEVEV